MVDTREESGGAREQGKGLNDWLTFEKPDGQGRVAVWPASIVGVEEFKPVKPKRAPGVSPSDADAKDVFIHSNDFHDPIPVAESFESVLERTRKAWDEENKDENGEQQ